MKAKNEIQAAYRERRDRFAADEKRWGRQDRLLTHLRLAAFLVAASLFVIGVITGVGKPWYVAGSVAVAGFVALVTYHDHVCRHRARARELTRLNEQCLARLDRRWHDLEDPEVDIPDQHRATSTDLDLFGHASLFQLICCANTPAGRQTIRDWFLQPASPDEIRLRQKAVTELAPDLALREELMLAGRLLANSHDATERFVQWAESPPWLARFPLLRWTCRVLPAIGLLCLLLTVAGWVSADVGGAAVLVVWALNILVSVLFSGSVHDIFTRVNTRKGEVGRYLELFRLMYRLPADSSKLEQVKQQATERGGGVLLRMRQLSGIMALANISHSALMFILVYLPLQIVVLYDFHVLHWLESWQRQHGRHVRFWFNALGQCEALASLAVLAHDHPDWTLPEVATSTKAFEADALGHPLLDDQFRVVNDVRVGPPGTFLLVTGSNMSGKSTLLRSIGINAVLAQAGGPVCARMLRMPALEVATSMRVRDSLEDGVSFYMAELMRLKQVVDRAVALAENQDRQLLFLLDEILQGTNSRERHIAVVRVLSHLLEYRAIGAVSTHDLELAHSEPLTSSCQAVHFRETLHDHDARKPMTFDYKLRSGVATTTNALKLLELVGLGDSRNSH